MQQANGEDSGHWWFHNASKDARWPLPLQGALEWGRQMARLLTEDNAMPIGVVFAKPPQRPEQSRPSSDWLVLNSDMYEKAGQTVIQQELQKDINDRANHQDGEEDELPLHEQRVRIVTMWHTLLQKRTEGLQLSDNGERSVRQVFLRLEDRRAHANDDFFCMNEACPGELVDVVNVTQKFSQQSDVPFLRFLTNKGSVDYMAHQSNTAKVCGTSSDSSLSQTTF